MNATDRCFGIRVQQSLLRVQQSLLSVQQSQHKGSLWLLNDGIWLLKNRVFCSDHVLICTFQHRSRHYCCKMLNDITTDITFFKETRGPANVSSWHYLDVQASLASIASKIDKTAISVRRKIPRMVYKFVIKCSDPSVCVAAI